MNRSLTLLERPCLLLACVVAVASGCLAPATLRAQTNRNSRAQPSSAQKHAATLRAADSSEGSRVSIFSDSNLDEYEAYRRGDRFYVKLPGIEVSQAQAKMRARGFEDATVQKSGSNSLLSFRLKPGTTARVDQRGNRLEVIFTIPGGTQSTNTGLSAENNSGGSEPASSPGNAQGTAKSQSSPATNSASPSSGSNSSLSTSTASSATPSANQAAANHQSPNDSWLGTGDWRTRLKFYGEMARLNWLPLVIGLLVLLLIVAALLSRRSKARRRKDIVSLPRKLGGSPAVKAAPAAPAPQIEQLPEIEPVAVAAAAAASAGPTSAAPDTPPVVQENVDVARVQAEATSMLAGGKYDNNVTGTVDTGAREVIATELLSALAGRNPERRERAREAFIESGYFDDATRDLRVAEAPAERASAARKLALVRDNEATPHLVAALEDEAPEVRRAAVDSLADLRDPAAIGPLNTLLSEENDRRVPHSVIRHAIEACATVEPPATAAAAEMLSAPNEPDREVIEL